MEKSQPRHWIAAVIGIVLLAGLMWPAIGVAQSTEPTTFSGRATGVRATVLGISTALSDTGPLPSSGGARHASLLDITAGGLSAQVLHASTVGQGDRSRSKASVADLSLVIEGHSISASFLRARATAMCTDQGASPSGSSEIVDLVVNGQPVVVAGSPNQTVMLPNGRIVINEQTSSTSGRTTEITVNALHVVITGIADIVVASAYADITCGRKICDTTKEFVTGGGWITGPSGARANFAVAGGKETGWGHLQYIEHSRPNPVRVKATSITGYSSLGGNARRIEGTAEVNGQPGFSFQADVADSGEPGRLDTFTLRLSPNGYVASGMLGGGNLQLHDPCQ